jgi:class 3 adenylate cyclase
LYNYTSIGDKVNLAQRLGVSAKTGQILIDQAAYEIVVDRVLAHSLYPLQIKGRSPDGDLRLHEFNKVETGTHFLRENGSLL